jgi:GWxTD domain-containing protein
VIRKTGLLSILIIMITPLQGFSQDREQSIFPLTSTGTLPFSVDVYQYEEAREITRLEVAYLVDFHHIPFRDNLLDSNSVMFVHIQLINNQKESLVHVHERKCIDLRDSGDGLPVLLDLKRFRVQLDTVTLSLVIQDSASGLEGQVKQDFPVRSYIQGLSVSDLSFVSHAQKATGSGVFEKHGILLIPNPSRLFTPTTQKPNIYVYYEINNLFYHANSASLYDVEYRIDDLHGKTLLSESKRDLKKQASNSARVEVIPAQHLKTGTYRLAIIVTDRESEQSHTRTAYFRIQAEDDRNKLVLPMSEEDIRKYFNQIKYIASKEEKALFQNLNPIGKQQFLLNFWKSRDPVPETPQNEFMVAHFRRIAYCEDHFPGGIHSDRGRVYIQYGPPVDIHRDFSGSMHNKPIEKWIYAFEGRVEFVFVDRTGNGEFVLVHSTQKDEYHNPEWYQELK